MKLLFLRENLSHTTRVRQHRKRGIRNTKMEHSSGDAKLPAVQSLEDKLDLIDQEIQTLHQFCSVKGFSQRQVEKSAKPIWEYLKATKRQQWKVVLLTMTILTVSVAVAFMYSEPVVRLASACSRIAMIKILPYWDWTRYYHDGDCLLGNPYYNGNNQKLVAGDCEICENTETVTRVANVSQTAVAETYVKRDIPVVVTDGTAGWSAAKLFNLPFLYQLYNEDKALKQAPTCMFASNIRLKYGAARFFISNMYKTKQTNWYAHWEECETSAVRVLRQFFKRPYFIPPMVEMAKLNWILLSSNYDAKNYKPVDLGTSLMWLAQIKGKNRLRLVPRNPCNSTCSTLYTVLHEGEIVLWTDFLWLLDYQPITTDVQLNIAIAAGGFYD